MSCTAKNANAKTNYSCDVCKISIATEAEYALHEFSKKHCDNLLRLAKNKPIIQKQKSAKAEQPVATKEPPKVSIVTTQGNFAKYGYFVPGEIYDTAAESKEFNTEYDPYLQKYAENPLKNAGSSTAPAQQVDPPPPPPQATSVAGFKRKKKKKLKTCQICNVTLQTVPQYEAHMRSPQHSWKLKMSGMGVSAHFVKASSDFHSIQTTEEPVGEDQFETSEYYETAPAAYPPEPPGTGTPTAFPTLYCDICELLLNSEQQFNAHVKGKSHNDNVAKKAETKTKKQQLESPSPNQLYCYSCKVALNNLYQYNEHKLGKKHKMKCRRLMREGITIPPEERIASWGLPKMDPNKPIVYPELYEKSVRKAQPTRAESVSRLSESGVTDSENGAVGELHSDSTRGGKAESDGEMAEDTSTGDESEDEEVAFNVLGEGDLPKCSICEESFADQSRLGDHLGTEEHARKILERRNGGMSEDEILGLAFKDKWTVKPDEDGRFACPVCSVATGSSAEFERHVASIFHRRSAEEFRRKRRTEVELLVQPDDSGMFTCGVCERSFAGLVEYNNHLHVGHHAGEGTGNSTGRKRTMSLSHRRGKQRHGSGAKRKDLECRREKCEKNPGGEAADSEVNADSEEPKTDAAEDCHGTKDAAEPATGEKRKAKTEGRKKSGKRARRSRRSGRAKDSGRSAPEYQSSIKPLMALQQVPAYPQGWGTYPPMQYYGAASYGLPGQAYPIDGYQQAQAYHSLWPGYPPTYN